MILPAQTIRKLRPITPFHERTVHNGMSFGLSHAGYDVRVAETIVVPPGGFLLASTIEKFNMPNDLLAIVHDKSTWARRGVCVQNTVIEPGWRGFLTLELSNHSTTAVSITYGDPIAQIIFSRLEEPTEAVYAGKYQDQEAGPQSPRLETFTLPPGGGSVGT
jgi:dCTP deaminase